MAIPSGRFYQSTNTDETELPNPQLTTDDAATNGHETPSRKGKPNKRAGSPRARITAENAHYLAFASLFPAANSEAYSVLANRQDSNLGRLSGGLPTVASTENKLRKLHKLGTLDRFRQATTGDYLYGITPLGNGYAQEFGYGIGKPEPIVGLSLERLNHYKMIAHVAAQLASPQGFFKDSLGLEPVSIENLYTEQAMRRPFSQVKRMLDEQAKQGKPTDFGRWRTTKLQEAIQQVKDGKLDWSDLIEAYPVLLTLGQPQREGMKSKVIHQPDLAIILDQDRDEPRSKNIMVEVELSKKTWQAYDAILATLKAELDKPYIYSRAVYFTVGTQIPTLLKKVDAAGEYNLISSGKLIILPIRDREGNAIIPQNRVTVGE